MTGQSPYTAASGLYALVNLDGSPVDAADCRRLDLSADGGPIAAMARDAAQPLAVHQHVTADSLSLFAGFLDESQDLAASLGLARQADPLTIAVAAWEKHGSDMPYHALGEWSLLRWNRTGRLDLVSSMPRRDRICFAKAGNRIAVAPNIWALAQLPWIDSTEDVTGLAFAMMPFHVRQEAGLATAMTGVRELPFGASISFDRHGEKVGRSRSWRSFEAPAYRGSQRDAMAEAELLLRHSMSQRICQGSGHGALLSGGLDSSLVTWLLADSLGTDRPFPCLTSAAPDGSDLPNELDKATIVGNTLGLPIHPVLPPEEWSPYRPSVEQTRWANGTMQSPRHYLYHRFGEDAAALGIDNLFDGMYGEHTVTARYPLNTWSMRLRQLVQRLRGREPYFTSRQSHSFIRIAPHRIAQMPAAVVEAQRDLTEPPYRLPNPGERWLFVPGDAMRLGAPSELVAGKVRSNFPFRDIRLWRLFKGFPVEFALKDGLLRAPVRMILEGRLPDSIRLQPKGLGISPDYMTRLRRHAMAEVDRIPLFRQAEIDDWIDLEWLDTNLKRISEQGTGGVVDALEVQLTAMNAEFLLWWRNGMAINP